MADLLQERQELVNDYNEMVDHYNTWFHAPPSANRTEQLRMARNSLRRMRTRINEIDRELRRLDPRQEGAEGGNLPTAKGIPKTEQAWKQLAPPEFKRRDEFWKDPAYRQLQDYALSDVDIKNALKTDKVHIYAPDLYNVNKIDDLFDKKGRAVILYLTTGPTNGHWVGMIKKGDTIHYFDPYGGMRPDGERVWLSNEKLKELDQKEPRLSQLLAKSKYKVTYNPYAYQSNEMNNNTCGRHVISRLYYSNLSEPDYRKMIMNSGLDPDEFVIRLTHKLIGK